jgi:hypothetical protein
MRPTAEIRAMQQRGVGRERLRGALEAHLPARDHHCFAREAERELRELLDQQHPHPGLGDRLHDRHQPQEHDRSQAE